MVLTQLVTTSNEVRNLYQDAKDGDIENALLHYGGYNTAFEWRDLKENQVGIIKGILNKYFRK